MKNHFSPRELADAVGISESSIKRWADRGRIVTSRTQGGHRRIPLAEALKFVREMQADLIEPEALGLTGYISPRHLPLDEPIADRMFTLLRDGREDDAIGLLQSLHLAGEPLAALIDGPMRESLAQVGELWRNDPDEGIYWEHRATQICIRALHRLRSLQLAPPSDAPVALGAAIDGDPYILPTLSAAVILQSIGYAAVDLGPDTPAASLASAIRDQRPALVWVSLTTPKLPKKLVGALARVAEASNEVGAALAVGGQELDAGIIRQIPGIFAGKTMVELSAFASALFQRTDGAKS